MRIKLILLFLSLSLSSHAWKLLIIQTISNTGKTFVTRTGKVDGFTEGVEGTFTKDDIALTAKAVEVSRDFTVWKIKNDRSRIPFKKGEPVTFNYSNEAIWLKIPEPDLKVSGLTLKKPDIDDSHILDRRTSSLIFKGHRGSGLSESVSGVDAVNDGSRQQGEYEIIYSQEVLTGLTFDLGFRYDIENTEFSTFAVTTSRQILTFGTTFYINQLSFAETVTPYVHIGVGYGRSSSTISGEALSGTGFVLPNTRFGFDTLISKNWTFQIELGMESLSFTEAFTDGTEQKTTQLNMRGGVGLRYIF